MQVKQLISVLLMLPLCAFGQNNPTAQIIEIKPEAKQQNIITKSYSNEKTIMSLLTKTKRSIDFPTQIIRTHGYLSGQNLDCDTVNERISNEVLDAVNNPQFIYNSYVSCSYDVETNLATQFRINSYFDPVDDKAIEYIKKYLAENNGNELFGTPINIESAKELIISNNIMVGFKKSTSKPPFLLLHQDRSNFTFKSNYEFNKIMLADVYENFYSDDSEKILPFLDRWIYPDAGYVYHYILPDANYVELQPERIFVMDKDDIFVSRLKYYFAHLCFNHESHRCLKLV